MVAVGTGTNTIATSNDGINWIGRGATTFTNNGNGAAWNGSLWVAVGTGGNTIATSNDGINWTGVTNSTSIFGTSGSIGYGVAWNGSRWVAVGTAGATFTSPIVYSSDGVSWSNISNTNVFGTSTGTGYGVAWNGSLWVAVGSGTGNTIATSPDGINWTGRGLYRIWRSVEWFSLGSCRYSWCDIYFSNCIFK
ncbi:MAG: hypothetical protein EBT76_02620 [Microbacteriaceae bacterium]|nr:hypothetical protein [Microbacteriaceae bacterium]